MANIAERWEDNITGKYYVDKSCIFCNLCIELAPNNLINSPQNDHVIIYKQPDSDEEISQCKEAIEQCPVEAIGDDNL